MTVRSWMNQNRTAWLRRDGTFRSVDLGLSPQWVSLLATTSELDTWNSRRVTGPFANAGDFDNGNSGDAPNPGEWSDIVFQSGQDWASSRWGGPTSITDGRVNVGGTTNDPPGASLTAARQMAGASFKALMDDRIKPGSGDALATAIISEIDAQRQEPNLDFGSRTQYPYDYYNDVNPLFVMCWWLNPLVVAYSNAKALVGGNTAVEQWFEDLAYLAEDAIHGDGTNMSSRFPERKNDDYITGRASSIDVNTDVWGQLADGSDMLYMTNQRYMNNRRMAQSGLVGLVGALRNDSFLIGEFERFMREWVGFGINLSTGSYGDADRDSTSGPTLPQLGQWYTMSGLHELLLTADALARLGNTTSIEQLVNIGSTHETYGTFSADKTLRACVNTLVGWINETNPTQVYTPSGGGYQGNSAHRRTTVNPGGNMYYWDATVLRMAAFAHHKGWAEASVWRDAVRRVGTPEGYGPQQGLGGVTALAKGFYTRFLDPYGIEGVYPNGPE